MSGSERPPAGRAEPKAVEAVDSESLAALTERLLRLLEQKITAEPHRVNVGDFIRLLQMRKEINEKRPREVTVTWVEPSGEADVPA